jgi:peptidoglycan/LPS O-acetylase OafA/YrhL
VKKTKSSIKIVLSVFFISQLISNFIILNSPHLLLHHWRWLFYPLIALVFILFVAFIQRKEQRVRTLLFGLLLLSVATTIIAIKTPSTFATVSQIVLLVICSLGILFSRNAEVKLKE